MDSEYMTLKRSNCKNCHKCIRHCPVKAIRFSGNHAYIIGDECIMCGQCFVVCPQGAKEIVSELEKVRTFIRGGETVVATLAPSFIANYDGVGINAMREALRKLGFADVEETAAGAALVKTEYERMIQEEGRSLLISSCCHSVNLLVQKHFPALLPYLADVLSPMQASCKDIKNRIPGAKTVFIGPCVAKKDEAQQYEGIVDAVLTFNELSDWMKSEGITPEKSLDHEEYSRSRFFPVTGGILKTMDCTAPGWTYLAVDGTENCIAALRDIEAGELDHCFIEMSACAGGCIGGPVMEKEHRSPIRDYKSVADYAGINEFAVTPRDHAELGKDFISLKKYVRTPSEAEITETLRKMGKTRPMDELNCGSCGYETCRAKAAAIIQGKAEISMCLPYLKEKAESFSDSIAEMSPNAILVVNEDLEVQQINREAVRLFNLRSASDILGDQITRIMDAVDLIQVLSTGIGMHGRREYLPECGKYVNKTIVYDREYHLLLCILQDVTEEELQYEHKKALSRKTIETADQVVEKQMRIVQEIASLLGETAAETKIALTKLKESVQDE